MRNSVYIILDLKEIVNFRVAKKPLEMSFFDLPYGKII